jgi:sec-independent protein translocase protein TatA
MFGNIGAGEMIFVLVVLLLVFGAKRLPEIGSSLGKGIREFKRSVNEIQGEVSKGDDTPHQVQRGVHTPPPQIPTPTQPTSNEPLQK